METLTREKVTHLVSSKFNGVAHMHCRLNYKYKAEELAHPKDVVPTCPTCLRHHFQRAKTNHYYMKMSERDSRRAGILMNGLGTLIECQRANDAGGDCEETKKGAYPFIPMSIGAAMQTFEHLEKHLKKEKRWCGHNTNDAKFLDAGCGIGNVLLLASIYQLANRYHGIEYFEDTANRARTWLGINNPRRKNLPSKFSIIQDDILTFKDYGAYDIIYFYCPMLEPRLQIRFEERLEDEMQVGAILIPRMKRGVMIREDYRFELLSFDGVAEKIFLKVKDGPRKKSEMDLIDRYTRHDPEREAAMQKLIKAGTLRG